MLEVSHVIHNLHAIKLTSLLVYSESDDIVNAETIENCRWLHLSS